MPFFIDRDASSSVFDAILHQGAVPITFFSHAVAPQHAKLAAYERELIGLVKAVRHWQPYVWAQPFTIRTDHFALKFLLDQRLSTIPSTLGSASYSVMTSWWNTSQDARTGP